MLIPMRDFVIVQEFKPELPNEPGLILSEEAKRQVMEAQAELLTEQLRRGIVRSVGPMQTEVQVGDIIRFNEYSGIHTNFENKLYIVLMHEELYCKEPSDVKRNIN